MAHNYEEQRNKIVLFNRTIDDLVQRNIDEFLKLRATIRYNSRRNRFIVSSGTRLEEIGGLRLEQLSVRASSKISAAAFCGENSSGKTAFIHLFLDIGKILPSADGPVTGRIAKLTYAPAEHACVRVYKSLRDRTLDQVEVSLTPFFAGQTPDWPGIKQELSKHVIRPQGIDENSEEFDAWARCLVEIHLPSARLAQGIDVYDTPGFLIGDAPIFTEILHDLVELIHPTIIFMYGNASTADETSSSFLAIKAALHDVDYSSFFFLNSKADVDRMPKLKKNMPIEQFSILLGEERVRRYEMLLHAPFLSNATLKGLPASIDQCLGFDLCSATSQIIKPYGPLMNHNAKERITRFVLRSKSTIPTQVCQAMLPMIDFFLELAIGNKIRASQQPSDSEESARAWVNTLFERCRSYVDQFVVDAFARIFMRFEVEKDAITEQFSLSGLFCRSTERQFTTALLLHVIRPAVRQTVTSCFDRLTDELCSSLDSCHDTIAKEILAEALGHDDLTDFAMSFLDGRQNTNAVDPSILYTANTISMAILACASTVETRFWDNIISTSATDDRSPNEDTARSQPQAKIFVQRLMSNMQRKLTAKQSALREASRFSGHRQEKMLKLMIQRHYEKVSSRNMTRQNSLEHMEQYAGRLCRIECELIAARDMAKSVGHLPLVRAHEEQSTMFSWFTLDWADEKNLMVKRLTQPLSKQPDAVYYEAHYQHRVARLRHPHIFNLRSLYQHAVDDESSELWMIFPPIFSTVEQFLREKHSSLAVEQLLRWTTDIADALKVLHNNQLVHGNVILSNILLSRDGQVLLADRIDGCDRDVDRRYRLAGTIADVDNDVKGLASVGKLLRQNVVSDESNASVLLSFDLLMSSYEQTQPNTAESIQQKLAALLTPS